MALREQAVAVAVIGATGSGKSTFINLASGSDFPVSKSSGSCTTELQSSTFSLDKRTVTLIDTPGFDSTTQNVLHVLKLISDSFSGLRKQGIRLAGVIYMHSIIGDCIGGISRRNFHIFHKFCGDTSLRDVVIVTNKWSEGEHQPCDGKTNEQFANKDELFRSAIDKGARMLGHDGSRESAYAILRHFIAQDPPIPPPEGDPSGQKTNPIHTNTSVHAVHELTSQVERHVKVFGELYQGIHAATFSKDDETKEMHEQANNSLEKIERIRYDLEKMVTDFATANSRLEDENRRYREGFSTQKVEAELRTRLLEEECRARELAEAERSRAEAQLAEERALWERQKTERQCLKDYAGPKYNKFFVRGALAFALVCMSRFMFDGSTFLLQ